MTANGLNFSAAMQGIIATISLLSLSAYFYFDGLRVSHCKGLLNLNRKKVQFFLEYNFVPVDMICRCTLTWVFLLDTDFDHYMVCHIQLSSHSPQGETDVWSPRGYGIAGVVGGWVSLAIDTTWLKQPTPTGGQVHAQMVCIGTRNWFQRRQVCHHFPCTLWIEERWRTIPCPLDRLHATTGPNFLSCQSRPVEQRGEMTRNWSIVLLLHLDLHWWYSMHSPWHHARAWQAEQIFYPETIIC
jgi:hypothetical protein